MGAALLDGKALGAKLVRFIAENAATLPRPPGLAVVLAGDDPASRIYVARKQKQAQAAGFVSRLRRFGGDVEEAEVAASIRQLNEDEAIDGILLQLPLPAHLSRARLLRAIDPQKDCDGLTPAQAGLLAQGREGAVIPCTARGCLLLLQQAGIVLEGKRALVIGRSELVGRPLALLLLNQDCTVMMAHSKSRHLPQLAQEADILAAAAGKPGLVGADWIKPGAAVLDIGIHRSRTGLCGDVQFDAAAAKAGWISPVPGGVGPMTVACLLLNTFTLACRRQKQPAPQVPVL